MPRLLACCTIAALLCGLLFLPSAADQPERPLNARFPALSPDGATLVFEYWGDLWAAPVDGAGVARKLTSHLAYDWLPRYAPDGKSLAFVSNRGGNDDVWVMPAQGPGIGAGEAARAVTAFSGGDGLCGWNRDGSRIIFTSNRGLWSTDLYTVDAAATQPPRQLTKLDHYSSTQAVELPDGGYVYTRGNARWWRKRYRGTAQFDLWRLYPNGHAERLTDHNGNDEWPMLSADGATVYYVSDQDGIDNIWALNLASGEKHPLTDYREDGVQWPSIGAGGRQIVYEWNGGIWRLPTAGGHPQRIPLSIAGESRDNWQVKQHFDEGAEEFSVSPHGKYVVLAHAGDLWAMKDPGAYKDDQKPDQDLARAWRLTSSDDARERQPVFAPDNLHVAYCSDADGDYEIYLQDLTDFSVRQLTDNTVDDLSPQFEPGNSDVLYHFSGNRTLVRQDLRSGETRTVAEGRFRDAFGYTDYSVSPDGKWVAYEQELDDWSLEVFIRPSDGSGEAVNITRDPEWDGAPRWSADGRRLIFRSSRSDRNSHDEGGGGGLYVVDLNPEAEKYDTQFLFEEDRKKPEEEKPKEEDQAKADGTIPGSTDILSVSSGNDDGQDVRPTEEAKPAANEDEDKDKKEPPKVVIDFTDIHLRARRAASQNQVGNALLSADGEWIVYEGQPEGQGWGIWAVKAKGGEEHRINDGGWQNPQWAADGGRIYYQTGGTLRYMKYSNGNSQGVETIAAHGDFTLDRRQRYRQMFREGWHILGETFYDPQLHGVDWNAVYAKYAPYVEEIATPEEFELVFSELLGELNASHLGITMAEHSFSVDAPVTCHLGLEFAEDYSGPGLKVSHITYRGPSDQPGIDVKPGDVLLKVEEQSVGKDIIWQQVLNDRQGLPTRLAFEPRAAETESQETKPADAAGGTDILSVSSGKDDGQNVRPTEDVSPTGSTREVVLKPITYGDYQELLYREWEKANEDRVSQLSGGRIGYIHIRSMSGGELHKFEREFYSEMMDRSALIVDVRFNPGGFIHEPLFDMLDRNPFGFNAPRGGEKIRQPARVFDKPKALLINARSGSDAEIFPAGWRQLGLGPVIGVDTSGQVIGTSGFQLIDGTWVRLPIEGWWELSGRNLETSGTPPDIYVDVSPDELRSGTDAQLEKAVAVLLEKL